MFDSGRKISPRKGDSSCKVTKKNFNTSKGSNSKALRNKDMNTRNKSIHKGPQCFVDDFYKNISTFVDPVKMPVNNRFYRPLRFF
mgnify:CR=1 FL=1